MNLYVSKIHFYKKVRDNIKILTLIINRSLGEVLIVAVLVRRWERAKKRCSMLICIDITLIYVMENLILLVNSWVILLIWRISPNSGKVSRLLMFFSFTKTHTSILWGVIRIWWIALITWAYLDLSLFIEQTFRVPLRSFSINHPQY
jgi:hypothetical protein